MEFVCSTGIPFVCIVLAYLFYATDAIVDEEYQGADRLPILAQVIRGGKYFFCLMALSLCALGVVRLLGLGMNASSGALACASALCMYAAGLTLWFSGKRAGRRSTASSASTAEQRLSRQRAS